MDFFLFAVFFVATIISIVVIVVSGEDLIKQSGVLFKMALKVFCVSLAVFIISLFGIFYTINASKEHNKDPKYVTETRIPIKSDGANSYFINLDGSMYTMKSKFIDSNKAEILYKSIESGWTNGIYVIGFDSWDIVQKESK